MPTAISDLYPILEDVLPGSVAIESLAYEGTDVVIYTTTPEYFSEHPAAIGQLAQELQKPITIRPVADIHIPQNEATDKIESIVPDKAGLTNIQFTESANEVILEAERPGMVIGKNGDRFREIAASTGWTPEILRTPPLDSTTVQDVRSYLLDDREERRSILERIGEQIHSEPLNGSEPMVRVTTLGCSREVGRAAFILSTGNRRILIDCGDKPGTDDTPYLEAPEGIRGGVGSLDAVVLTHAHLDHSALIPLLFKYNYNGPVFCTAPTRDLMGLLTLDYLKVAGAQGRSQPYSSAEIEKVLKHTITVDYATPVDITTDTRLMLSNAGHILGSASAHFSIRDGEHGTVFSGDIQYEPTALFEQAATSFPSADTLVMEATYGGRDDIKRDRRDAEQALVDIAQETLNNDGTLLIPAFAVGRSQEIMLILEKAIRQGDLPDVDVYLDGMIGEATAIHSTYPEYLNQELRQRIFNGGDNPFLRENFTEIGGGNKQRRAVSNGDPCIVLTTAGMVTGGPVLSWLQYLADQPESTLVFVGYQAEGTLGREIEDGARAVSIRTQSGDYEEVELELSVESIDGFSGHADREGLMQFMENVDPRPNDIMFVHGDEESVLELATDTQSNLGVNTIAPKNLETYRFD